MHIHAPPCTHTPAHTYICLRVYLSVFARDIWVQSSVKLYQPKTQNMRLDASLLYTQPYKTLMKRKCMNRRKGVAPSLITWCCSY